MEADLTGKFCSRCGLWEKECVCLRRGFMKRLAGVLGIAAAAPLVAGTAAAAEKPKQTYFTATNKADRKFKVVLSTGEVLNNVKSCDVEAGEILVYLMQPNRFSPTGRSRVVTTGAVQMRDGSVVPLPDDSAGIVMLVMTPPAFAVVDRHTGAVVAKYGDWSREAPVSGLTRLLGRYTWARRA